MVFIVTALMIEAAPIIEYFKLKRDMNSHEYAIYRNESIALIISGVGKIKSAMATVYLYCTYKATKNDYILNIGFCGAGNARYELGTMLIINKVTDMDTGRDLYPDVFFGHFLPQEAICCFSKPVHKEDFENSTDFFCDMESSGIMEAARKLTYAHNVVILKIISDYLSPDNLDKNVLQPLIKNQLCNIKRIIEELIQHNSNMDELILDKEKQAVDMLSKNLKFTEAMKQMLMKDIKKAKLKNLEPLKILESLTVTTVNSKSEGKKIFEQIRQQLK